jgi:hypothetical protein
MTMPSNRTELIGRPARAVVGVGLNTWDAVAIANPRWNAGIDGRYFKLA